MHLRSSSILRLGLLFSHDPDIERATWDTGALLFRNALCSASEQTAPEGPDSINTGKNR